MTIFIFLFFRLIFYALAHQSNIENCSLTGYTYQQPVLVLNNFSEVYTVIELGSETGARCLDGTNYKFYFTPGKGEGHSKFMFYWAGSAFCGADALEPTESCYERISTDYGTSNSSIWGENGTEVSSSLGMGWFSSMEDYNPLYWNWNKVQMLSCDGLMHMGSLDEPIYYKDTNMYLRGFNNTMATIEHLKEQFHLFNATEIILGGASSGATGSLIWTSFLQDYFPKSIRLSGISDGGAFVHTYSESNKCYMYRFFMKGLSTTFNFSTTKSSILYRRCKYRDTTEFWKCLMIEYIYDTIDVPIFIINSQNDIKQILGLNGLYCMIEGDPTNCNYGERKQITKIREKFLKVMLKIKIQKPNWGFWLRTCFEHVYHVNWGWYGHEFDVFSAEAGNSTNAQTALYGWYVNDNAKGKALDYIDLLDWQHNPFCHYGDSQYDEEN